MTSLTSLKNLAITLAKKAGKIQLKHRGKLNNIEHKSVRDLVSEVDYLCEKAIMDGVLKKYPNHAFLCEESGVKKSKEKDNEYKWIIDPLDGTINYVKGLPIFGVSIAVEYKGKVVVGVIYLPVMDEMYVAVLGFGSTLNGKNIKVSKTNKLIDTFVLYDSGFARNIKILKTLEKLREKVMGFRMPGCATFSLVAIATGSSDAYIEFDSYPWDIAAGALIIEEAGGKFTDFSGKEWSPYMGAFVASNGPIHSSIKKLIIKK